MNSRHTYGGQAVIEGVMIKGKYHSSVAVRRPDGNISVRHQRINSFFTGPLRKLPVFRGFIILTETLILGMQALMYSANVGINQEEEELNKWAIAGMMGFSIILGIGLFFIVPVIASTPIENLSGSDLFANLVEGVIRLILFLAYLILIGKMNEIKRVFMYHGAEHMTVHAQENDEKLNVDTVRKYPKAHPRCGTAFLLVVMTLTLIAFVFIGRDPFWWLITSRIILIPLIAGISYEIIRLNGLHPKNPLVGLISGPSLALQSLTTRTPEDDQIEIAIVAMENTLNADKEELLNKK